VRAAPHAPLFTRREAIAAGAFAVGTAALLPFDERIAHWFQRPALQRSRVASDVATGARVLGIPGTFVIAPALYVAGRISHHEHATELGVYGSEAIVVAIGTTLLIKGVTGRARPYVVHDADAYDFQLGRGFPHREDYSSFASDHAAAAFALASATTSETSRWWPGSARYLAPLLFGGATTVALSRMYDDKHWASDVMMGAAIGTVSGWTVVRYNHAHPRNWVNRWLLSATVLPAPSGGAFVLWSFPVR
jgi:membrane-associated phospholipid phosphatase